MPTPAHILTLSQHAPRFWKWLRSWMHRSGRRAARTRQGLQLPCLICPYLSSLALLAPQSFHPGLATHLLTHSDPYSLPAGQAAAHLWHLLESVLFPCRRECLVGEGPTPTERRSLLVCSAFFPFLAPTCPGGPSECSCPGKQVGRLPLPPATPSLALPQPCCHLGHSNWLSFHCGRLNCPPPTPNLLT